MDTVDYNLSSYFPLSKPNWHLTPMEALHLQIHEAQLHDRKPPEALYLSVEKWKEYYQSLGGVVQMQIGRGMRIDPQTGAAKYCTFFRGIPVFPNPYSEFSP